jgi:hypothetical protein
LLEEEEDNDMLMNSQKMGTSGPKKKKEKIEKERIYAAIEPKERLFRFQQLLKKQVYWLIEFQKYPKQIEGVVRDIWTIWIAGKEGLGGSGLVYKKPRLFNKDLGIHLSLVFIRMSASMLRIPLTYMELIQFVIDSDFPFLVEDEFVSTLGSYRNIGSVPSFDQFLKDENTIWNLLFEHRKVNASYQKWNVPLTALKLFDLLEIPISLYPHCRTICDHVDFKTKTPVVGIVCLWLSKFVDSNSMFSLIPLVYRTRNSPITSLATTTTERSFRAFVNPEWLRFEDSRPDVQDPDPLKPFKIVHVMESKKIKSYFGSDQQGKYPARIVNRVLKVSSFFAVDPEKILADLRHVESTLYYTQRVNE